MTSCPVGDLVDDPHTFDGPGVPVTWDVAGDVRARVNVCKECAALACVELIPGGES